MERLRVFGLVVLLAILVSVVLDILVAQWRRAWVSPPPIEATTRGSSILRVAIYSPLPRSLFDRGYLRLSGVWELWDSRYSGSTTEREDSPYVVNMINQYYKFEVYRP